MPKALSLVEDMAAGRELCRTQSLVFSPHGEAEIPCAEVFEL